MPDLRHAGTFIIFILLFLAYQFSSFLVRPPAIDKNHPFQTEQTLSRLSRLLGDEAPHPVDTDANDKVRDRLTAEIRDLGFEPIIRDDFVCSFKWQQLACGRVRNVLFWVTEPGDNAVMVASHYDSVPAGPGASDDMAGVAVSLEIASVLKGQSFVRPLLVLITDGEEAGLLGAKSFVESDPLAKQVGAVVNLEARGVSGPASMFQTSRPNGQVLEALVSDIRLPVANSLSADIYEIMPNDTDVSEFLALDVDALNYAFVEGARYYHTPRDSLINLDTRTLFHMGASSLASVQSLLSQNEDEADSAVVYTDVLGVILLKLPQGWSLALFGVCGLVFVGSFVVKRGPDSVRAAFFPLWSVLSGVLLAAGATYLISLMHSEISYASAHPWALRGLQLAAALIGPAIGLSLFYRSGNRTAILLAGCIWAAVLGFAATLFLPGAAILFLPSLILAALGSAFLMLNMELIFRLVLACAAVLFAIIALPLVALGETALFIENAAAFVVVILLIAIVSVPLALPEGRSAGRAPLIITAGLGGLLTVFGVLSAVFPAFSPSQPQHVSVLHAQTVQDAENSNWAIRSGDGLPDAMKSGMAFTYEYVPGLPGKRYSAPAPRFVGNELEVSILNDRIDGAQRALEMNIAAPDADIIWINANRDGLKPLSLIVNGREVDTKGEAVSSLVCQGRSCRNLVLDLMLAPDASEPILDVMSLQYGLGPESEEIVKLRPESAVPIQWGDVRVTSSQIDFSETGQGSG